MNKLVVLAALIMALAGCGGSGTSSVPVGTVTVAPGTWKGAVSVSPPNPIFTNYSVQMTFDNQIVTQAVIQGVTQNIVNVFGSYSSSTITPTTGTLFGTITDYTVALTGPSSGVSFGFPFPFSTPTGCTVTPLTVAPAILTNNFAGTDILVFNFVGTYNCGGTPFTETWVATLYKH
ncbi:MAG TPA: hypothetical protein VIH45_06580 [Desulfuromonadaceae bacterium]